MVFVYGRLLKRWVSKPQVIFPTLCVCVWYNWIIKLTWMKCMDIRMKMFRIEQKENKHTHIIWAFKRWMNAHKPLYHVNVVFCLPFQFFLSYNTDSIIHLITLANFFLQIPEKNLWVVTLIICAAILSSTQL